MLMPFAASGLESTVAAPLDTVSSSTPAWLSQVNAGEPGAFPVIRSFQASYRLSWSNVEAGRAEVDCTVSPNTGQISTKITGGTLGLARSLYEVDATHLTVADIRTLRPFHLDQTELESRKRKVAHVDFTPTGAERTFESIDRKNADSSTGPGPGAHKRAFHFPGMFDLHSAMLYIRSLPLTAGESRTLIAMTAGNPYLTTIKVVGRSQVKTVAGTYPAIECTVALSKINKRGELEPHKSFKSARVWISDDSDRLIIKAEATVFIGTVTLDLARVSFPGK